MFEEKFIAFENSRKHMQEGSSFSLNDDESSGKALGIINENSEGFGSVIMLFGSGGVLRGFTKRAFPYTNLTNVDDLLKVPDFIAGVTNRIFEDHSSWWDVLCNIDTGKFTTVKGHCDSFIWN
ncbi:10951_t:CDS:2 [Gigaspora rosea]|nr:10951_t:CDS:2 [Gigaspora rosea]